MLLNFIIIIIFLVAMVLMGLYFSRRQDSTDRYFTAGRSLPGWAMGISLLATLISSMTFIAFPGAGYQGNWSLLTPNFMVIVAMFLVVFVLIPIYRKIIKVSAYEYFGERFGGHSIRLYSSFAFSLNHFAKMGFVFYLVALAIASMTGWNSYTVIIVMGIITVFYTLVGGIEGVIWTDVIQGILLTLGVLIALGYVLFLPEGGPAEVVKVAWAGDKFNLGSTDFSFGSKTIIVLLMYGFAWNFQKYSADQTVVQRYLVAKSDKEAMKGVMLGALLCVPVWTLFIFLGTCLWSFYQITGEALPDHIVKAEQVFPHFLMTHVPMGLNGLVLAALMAAAMSTLSSDLNALSAVGVKDYYKLFKPEANDEQMLRMGRIIVIICGLLCIIIAVFLVSSEGSALSLFYMVASIVSVGLAGLFFISFMSRRANKKGVIVGIITAILFTAWATATLGENKTFDLGFLNNPLHSYMIGIIGHVLLVVVGYGSSFLFKREESENADLTFWGWWRDRKETL